MTAPQGVGLQHALWLFGEEMGGGAIIGLASGYALLWLFRRLNVERSAFPVLAIGAVLVMFGGAQILGGSGFLAVYLAGVIVGNHDHEARKSIVSFFEALGWLAQICLFLMLGLLVTPHELVALIFPALLVTVVLISVARPAAVILCLLPFRWTVREVAFVSWVGLRGGVPIYLTIIPLLAGVETGRILFDIVFVVVIASLLVQGWTIGSAARLLKLDAKE
jgi:potassium/hydrogen antiporter